MRPNTSVEGIMLQGQKSEHPCESKIFKMEHCQTIFKNACIGASEMGQRMRLLAA